MSQLNLVGTAAPVNSTLQLTPNQASRRGAAWFQQQQKVDLGFSTSYEFSISNDGSDNIELIVQNYCERGIKDFTGDCNLHDVNILHSIDRFVTDNHRLGDDNT
ncbi:MAG: hypothetical protein R3C03_17855 [Pirellulaceae bacterium]